MPTDLLARSGTDKKIAGVCGGLAKWLEIDPTVVRLLYVLATFFTGLVPGMVAYIVLSVVMPPEGQP
jgi:phage shock protein C